MHVLALDHAFIRAEPRQVFGFLRDPAGYPKWWPGVAAGRERGRLALPVLGDVSFSTDALEEDVGLIVRLDGARVRGHLQWHIDAFRDGAIVYAGTDVEATGRLSSRRVLRWRASIHDAFEALQGCLEG